MAEDRQDKALRLADEILKLSQSTLMIKLRFLDMALSRFRLTPREGVLGTDGRAFCYDPWRVLEMYRANRYDVNRLTLHSLVHCIAGHMFTDPAVDRRLWDLACDMAAENVVLELDVSAEEAPERSGKMTELRRFSGKNGLLTAPRIYARLRSAQPGETRLRELETLFRRDDHTLWYQTAGRLLTGEEPEEQEGDEPNGRVPELRTAAADEVLPLNEEEENRRFWKYVAERIQTDLETTSVKYGAMAGTLLQNLREVNREHHDYADFLRRFAVSGETMKLDTDEFDYIYYTYGLTLFGNMPLIEPLEYRDTKRIKEFVIAIDTSGSVKGELVQRFVEKTYSVLMQQESFFTKINLHIIQCDAVVQEDKKITDREGFEEYLKTMQIRGLGGTDYRPVFEYVDGLIRAGEFTNLKGLIYFTDGFGRFPAKQPDYTTAFVFLNDELANPQVPVWAIRLVLQSDEI
ncbi:MAG: metallopeptidase [Oscillospiraceae bacterium]|nr:metallopeptidase [Oscillospiraceae bacterium]